MIRRIIVGLLTLAALSTLLLWPCRKAIIRHHYRHWLATNFIAGHVITGADAWWYEPPPAPARVLGDLKGRWHLPNTTMGVDAWDNPIWAMPQPEHLDRVRFVSFGGNGRDDNGAGDDLVYDVGPYPPEVKWPNDPWPPFVIYIQETPTWTPLAFLAAYPAFVFLRAPRRAWRTVRKPIIVVLSVLAIGASVLWVISYVPRDNPLPYGFYTGWDSNGLSFQEGVLTAQHVLRSMCQPPACLPIMIRPDGWTPERRQRAQRVVEVSATVHDIGYRITFSRLESSLSQQVTLRLPLWCVIVICAPYPILAFIRGPRRRYRRRLRGLCLTCAYNLTGNTSGVCPECGTTISTETEPIWTLLCRGLGLLRVLTMRRVIVTVLTLAAVGTVALGIASFVTTIEDHYADDQPPWFIDGGRAYLRYEPGDYQWVGGDAVREDRTLDLGFFVFARAYERTSKATLASQPFCTDIELSLWVPAVLFAVYPILVAVRTARARRRLGRRSPDG